MRSLAGTIFILPLLLFASGCNNDNENAITADEQVLVNALNENIITSIDSSPLSWEDNQIRFLDKVGSKEIVGLGEATHGTAEFFEAKHRILQYLVENHGFKVFAIEADFGESVYLNEAVQEGNTEQVRSIMRERMHFWTWLTEEVQVMIEWMSEYNKGKSEDEKIQYVGVDSQANTFNPLLLDEYLQEALPEKFNFASTQLEEIRQASITNYQDMLLADIGILIANSRNIIDSIEYYQTELTQSKGDINYEFYKRMAQVVEQVLVVQREYNDPNNSKTSRDVFMADNTVWARKFYGEKVVLWAHNLHVGIDGAYFNNSGSQGFHITNNFPGYTTIGFSFMNGSLTAVKPEGESFSIGTQSFTSVPVFQSLNYFFYLTGEDAFFLTVEDLTSTSEPWRSRFNQEINHLEIGAVFNGNASDYYYRIGESLYGHIIYFQESNATKLIPR